MMNPFSPFHYLETSFGRRNVAELIKADSTAEVKIKDFRKSMQLSLSLRAVKVIWKIFKDARYKG